MTFHASDATFRLAPSVFLVAFAFSSCVDRAVPQHPITDAVYGDEPSGKPDDKTGDGSHDLELVGDGPLVDLPADIVVPSDAVEIMDVVELSDETEPTDAVELSEGVEPADLKDTGVDDIPDAHFGEVAETLDLPADEYSKDVIADAMDTGDVLEEDAWDGGWGDVPLDVHEGEIVCEPDCEGKDCGDDGCGGSCGECTGNQSLCVQGDCICVPDCEGKECGDDGCGSGCDECPGELDVCVGGTCVCQPDCEGRVCGDDGCEGSCGECGGEQSICLEGECICLPDCDGKLCGGDGCAGNCGFCLDEYEKCLEGVCYCIPDCQDKECGDGGCDTLCGVCTGMGESCVEGQCFCPPQCDGKECGDDGCGGKCGACDDELYCTNDFCEVGSCAAVTQDFFCIIEGVCVPSGTENPANPCETCQPLVSQEGWSPEADTISCGVDLICYQGDCCDPVAGCLGKECGDDGCGGTCGSCALPNYDCESGSCVCQPACVDKQCGLDGCGGSCGECLDGKKCVLATCVCKPEESKDCCGDNVCWFDSCGVQGAVANQCEFGCTDGVCDNCVPDCDDVVCGDDGCGESCGECPAAQEECVNGARVCQPACEEFACGDDGCGGDCGTCPGLQDQCLDGLCACVPACDGIQCGTDGCGGSCGECSGQDLCEAGTCVCQPACAGKECGLDGCGGTCGECVDELECTAASCVGGLCQFVLESQWCLIDEECVSEGALNPQNDCEHCQSDVSTSLWTKRPDGGVCQSSGVCYQSECCFFELNCEGKECGSNGCGGTCGTCEGPQDACFMGMCVCIPICNDKECGSDGCTGNCGTCPLANDVCLDGICVCEPGCDGKECGADGCGSNCGLCPLVQDVCVAGMCVCEPECEGKECGIDGCGGTCGTCVGQQEVCIYGACECVPACDGKDCGSDGCNGSCGTCPLDNDVCESGVCTCEPDCLLKECGPDGCAGSCGTCEAGALCTPSKKCETPGINCGDGDCKDGDGEDCDNCQQDCGDCCGDEICQPYFLETCESCAADCEFCAEQCDDGNTVDWDGCTDSQASEFVVNETVDDEQSHPAAAAFGDGGFVLAWQSKDQDGDKWGIFGRRYLTGGTPGGGEFQINTHIADEQMLPAMAAHANGNFAVAWQSNKQDGDDYGAYLRLFVAGGAPLTGELQASTKKNGPQLGASLTAMSDGGYAVAWSGNGSSEDSGVFIRRISAFGSFPPGGVTGLNSWVTGDQEAVDLAALSSGSIAAVWASKDMDGSGWGISGRVLSGGLQYLTGEFQVNGYSEGDQENPRVAALAAGGFVVCWDGKQAAGDDHGVAARLFLATGEPVGSDFPVNMTTGGNQVLSYPVALAGGGFVASWQGSGQDGSGEGIIFRLFGASGEPASGEIPANLQYDGNQTSPGGTGLPAGGFVLAWTSEKVDDSGTAVVAARFDALGKALAP